MSFPFEYSDVYQVINGVIIVVEGLANGPYHFKFVKGCLPETLLDPFLNALSQIFLPFLQFAKAREATASLFLGLPSASNVL